MREEGNKAEADNIISEKYEKVSEAVHGATVRVLRVLTSSIRGRYLCERLIEFDIAHGYCDYPRSCVLDYWGQMKGKRFAVKADECYFGYVTVFVSGEKMGFEENPYYLEGATAEEMKWLESSLNELSEISERIEGEGAEHEGGE